MPEQPLHHLDLVFEARGATGRVSVGVSVNDNPPAVGCDAAACGFPICEATVSTTLRGYEALFGWVQLVGARTASARQRQFAVDPLQVFEDLDMPFGFYGLHPTLFDAPSRRDRSQELDWLAQSFLCVSPHRPMDRLVRPVVAFQWGFRMGGGDVTIVAPSPLSLSLWGTHLELLRRSFPAWQFEDDETP